MLKRESRGDHGSPRTFARRRSRRLYLLPGIGAVVVLGALVSLIALGQRQRQVDFGANPEAAETDSAPLEWTSDRKHYRAAVFLQTSDCGGNLTLLRPLLSLHRAGALQELEVIDVGKDAADTSLAAALPRPLKPFPIRRVTSRERVLLRTMEIRESPVALVFDNQNRVRMTLMPEGDPPMRVAQNRAVHHLLEGDPDK